MRKLFVALLVVIASGFVPLVAMNLSCAGHACCTSSEATLTSAGACCLPRLCSTTEEQKAIKPMMAPLGQTLVSSVTNAPDTRMQVPAESVNEHSFSRGVQRRLATLSILLI